MWTFIIAYTICKCYLIVHMLPWLKQNVLELILNFSQNEKPHLKHQEAKFAQLDDSPCLIL